MTERASGPDRSDYAGISSVKRRENRLRRKSKDSRATFIDPG